jgi:hypothetical protein
LIKKSDSIQMKIKDNQDDSSPVELEQIVQARVQNDPLEPTHRKRSDFIRWLVQCKQDDICPPGQFATQIPKRIVRFWNDIESIPSDVHDCLDSWKPLIDNGFQLLLFSDIEAIEYIRSKLGSRFKRAYDKCYHPAMQSDFFRLCYIYGEGGGYVDADDVYLGGKIEYLFRDKRLKLHPLCYDLSTNEMVSHDIFSIPRAYSHTWIFYFNNNPLIAPPHHPIVKEALLAATITLEQHESCVLPEIQSTTGPGNLSRSVFITGQKTEQLDELLFILNAWEDIALPKWPLSYRNDKRNWRLSNQKSFKDQNL